MRRYASLRGRREFAHVMRRGRPLSTEHFVLFCLPVERARAPLQRVGIVVTKKVGSAVERNRLRRRCKAIFDQHLDTRPSWYVLQLRPSAATLAYAQLEDQLMRVLETSRSTSSRLRRSAIRS